MTASEAIRNRRSIRKYKQGQCVTREQVKRLLEAAMMAPSACNTRPWEFVVVESREKLETIAKVHPYAKMLSQASLAIVVCALPDVQAREICSGYYPQDCGAATQNILLQAEDMGLGCCWCGVYPKEERMAELREILGLSATPFNIIAVGYPDEAPGAKGFYEEQKVTYV